MNILPFPGLVNLARAFCCRTNPDDRALASPWARSNDLVYWFSQSAWSMAVVSKWRRSISPEDPVTFWVPDYFCNQSLAGVRATGARLVFYPVTSDRRPDWNICNKMATDSAPDIFLAVHYFGIETDVEGIRSFCNRHGAIIIEDCAHVLLPQGGIGSLGDFVMYSQHKLLAVPDGALLLARPAVMRKLKRNANDFAESFAKEISTLPGGSASSLRWLMRQLLERLIPYFEEVKRLIKGTIPNADSSLTKSLCPPGQSSLSRKLLEFELPKIEARGWSRAENTAVLATSEDFGNGTEKIFPSVDRGFCFMFGLQSKSDTEARDLLVLAKKRRVPVLTWPDLSPEVLNDHEFHKTTIELSRRTVFFPVHHSLKARDLLARFSCNDNPIARADSGFGLRWDLSQAEWQSIYLNAPHSHLQQARAYSNAHAATSRWTSRFGAIEQDGNIVGVFSVIERRGPFGLAVARLNRGPIWTGPTFSEAVKVKAIKAIARYYRRGLGRLLYIAPNVTMTEQALSLLQQAGIRRCQNRPWHSLWLDLNPDEQLLRASLNGKWRNQLKAAEKNGLIFECSSSESSSEWMLDRHAELVSIRGFSGPSLEFIRELRSSMIREGDAYLVLRALLDDEPVAGISMAQHGTSGTYLLGWNGKKGRKIHANNFLLWNATLVLKKRGCSDMELGGINEWLTPGIAAFKRGMGGKEFRLVGEYSS